MARSDWKNSPDKRGTLEKQARHRSAVNLMCLACLVLSHDILSVRHDAMHR